MAIKNDHSLQTALIKAYKNYTLKKGKTPKTVEKLTAFAGKDFSDFKSAFKTMEELELALVLRYFKKINATLSADENVKKLSRKELHLAMLYMLVEKVEKDQIFLEVFIHQKRKDPGFIAKLNMLLSRQEYLIFKTSGKLTEMLENVKVNPKKTAIINHAMSVILFYLNDVSEECQDTDAFIEKTTDLLFKLSDTSTLSSIFDLGKFLYQRKKTGFNWE
jgi:hypothetical protein